MHALENTLDAYNSLHDLSRSNLPLNRSRSIRLDTKVSFALRTDIASGRISRVGFRDDRARCYPLIRSFPALMIVGTAEAAPRTAATRRNNEREETKTREERRGEKEMPGEAEIHEEKKYIFVANTSRSTYRRKETSFELDESLEPDSRLLFGIDYLKFGTVRPINDRN